MYSWFVDLEVELERMTFGPRIQVQLCGVIDVFAG
jgi:hypothetical protein